MVLTGLSIKAACGYLSRPRIPVLLPRIAPEKIEHGVEAAQTNSPPFSALSAIMSWRMSNDTSFMGLRSASSCNWTRSSCGSVFRS